MIWIPGNVPSSKNSKVATSKLDESTGKIRKGIFNSKQVSKYLQGLGVKSYSEKRGVEDYKTRPNLFRQAVEKYPIKTDYPIILGMHFVRDSKRRFDFNNASQIICDLLVAHRFIDDDDCQHLYPVPMYFTSGGLHFESGGFYSVDKHAAGVFLDVIYRDRFIGAVSVSPF